MFKSQYNEVLDQEFKKGYISHDIKLLFGEKNRPNTPTDRLTKILMSLKYIL